MPCASSTFVLNLHLLALVLPFPFLSTGRPLDCAFPNLVGSVIPKVRLHPRHCPPAACCAAAALLLDRLVRDCCLRRQSTSLASVCTLYHDLTFSFPSLSLFSPLPLVARLQTYKAAMPSPLTAV